jgi:preprotein translocase subunit SecA
MMTVHMNETAQEKIETLMAWTNKSADEVIEAAINQYLEMEQKRIESGALQPKDTLLSYDEFWDGVDL